MGQGQSKDQLLCENAAAGNIEAVKGLVSEGAGLEWIDKDGKTPLITACLYAEGYLTAKALIDLGANVNAYRPGRHAGTPLHHAAKRGLTNTVKLLLSHGANPFLRNDDGHTPLDFARYRGFTSVVRAIESHICFYSGWMRELYGPGFLEALAPQLLSRKIWVVIIPYGRNNPGSPQKLELAIYSSLQNPQPRSVVALHSSDIEEPKVLPSDTTLTIFVKSSKTRYKFASPSDGDKQQILALYNACRGIRQVTTSVELEGTQTAAATTLTQTSAELAMGMNASNHSSMEDHLQPHPNNQTNPEADTVNGWADTTNEATHNGWGLSEGSVLPAATSNGWMDEPSKEEYNGWGVPEPKPTENITAEDRSRIRPINANGWADISNGSNQGKVVGSPSSSSGWINGPALVGSHEVAASVPSAPPLPVDNLDNGPIQYPSIDFSSVELTYDPCVEQKGGFNMNAGSSSSCIICWESPVEGACVPCGHMAGCMSCLNEIKITNGDCPVCRAKIHEVIRLYAV